VNKVPPETPFSLQARLHSFKASVVQWMLIKGQEQDHLAMRLQFLAWIGSFGLPLYYLVWTVIFPQQYESLALRLSGVVLCLPAMFLKHLPWLARPRHMQVYEFIGITYVLPFFFTFMFLMNHGAAVWGESLLVALVVLFHFNLLWALASWGCGTLLAGAAFALKADAGFLVHPLVLEQAPIYLFTIVIVSVTRVGRRVLAREKLAGMAQALGMVSHELRTPLMSVAANVRGLERALKAPALQERQDGAAVGEAMARIGFEVRHMNQMIDLFLQSAAAMNQQLAAIEHVSMADAVAHVIDRYPFTGPEQRHAVSVVVRGDFIFRGKHELCVVLLLNLLRNALKALQRAGRGQVRIVVDGARARLLVMDSGCGIPRRQLPHIFERFYSWPPSSGAGIGLALCKDIVLAWQGRIACRSRESAYTVFALEFPLN